jgi:hypothetical protein
MHSAFRLRNKLKERIKKLSDQARMAKVTKPVGTVENTAVFDGKTYREIVADVSRLMITLRDFNIAIEKANAVNKADLITLESLKAEIAFYDDLATDLRQTENYSYEFNAAGGRDKVELEPVLDQKAVTAHLEELKTKKDQIEDRLAESNFRVEVDFDEAAIKKLL